jgi:hypothetical protein
VSSADLAKPSSDLSHEFVDLGRTQTGRLLFHFGTPFQQHLILSPFLVLAFLNNLLDGHFPFVKAHRLFLLDFGVGVCLPAGISQPKNEKAGVDTPATRATTARHLRRQVGKQAPPVTCD